jgi:AraC-like DNA-binding protein
MPCQVTGTLLQFVRDAGADAVSLAERHGLSSDAVGARDVLIPVAVRAALFDAAAALLDDPFLGLHVLAAFRRGHFGLLEYVMTSAATVCEAHERLCHYGPLLSPLSRFTWTRLRDGRSVLRHRIVGSADGAGRHGNELMMAGLIDGLRRLAGTRVERIWFSHAAPAHTGELGEFLGTSNLEFDALDNGYVLRQGDAELPMASADPSLSEIIRRQADAVLASCIRPSDVLDEVRAAVLACLPGGGPLLDHVARRLGTGSRTLQRHLKDRNIRFQDLLADVRRAESQRLVTGTPLPLGTIARELGYSDLANFLRAFRRWTGTTPSAFRRRADTQRSPQMA